MTTPINATPGRVWVQFILEARGDDPEISDEETAELAAAAAGIWGIFLEQGGKDELIQMLHDHVWNGDSPSDDTNEPPL